VDGRKGRGSVTSSNHRFLHNRIDQAIQSGRRLLVATDFDGTLAPIATSPQEVRLPWSTWTTLENMATLEDCTLFVLSGRSLEDLKARIKCPAILGGNHGLEIEGEGLRFEHERAAELVPELERVCSGLDDVLRRWRGAFLERKRLTATVHFRDVYERDQHGVVLAVRAHMASFGLTFGMRAGKKALEIHPRVGWNKGAAVNWVRQQLGLDDACCICIGDDRTDETMFQNCSPAVTIAIGKLTGTSAEYTLRDPVEVCLLLSHIAERMTSRGMAADPLRMQAETQRA
jgi:trehalose 6-phosphate phosphatase